MCYYLNVPYEGCGHIIKQGVPCLDVWNGWCTYGHDFDDEEKEGKEKNGLCAECKKKPPASKGSGAQASGTQEPKGQGDDVNASWRKMTRVWGIRKVKNFGVKIQKF